MRVDSLWRYPVKSLQGEQLLQATIDSDGMRGDRCFGIRDYNTGKVLTARREPPLLLAAASLDADGEPIITLPDGTMTKGRGTETDGALSDWLHRPVSLVSSIGAPAGTGEFFEDATDDTSPALEWTMPEGRFVDAKPLLLLTTSSLRAGTSLHPEGEWDPRRFRPNVLIEAGGDDWTEDAWQGSSLRAGSALLAPSVLCVRCTMVTRPQPGLSRDVDIYKSLARHHGGTFGIWTDVVQPGAVSIGDEVLVS
jgi:uncharacterized protein YcbX